MRRALFLIPLLLAACQSPAPKLAGAGMDMFTPVKLRIHPLSRVVSSAAAPPSTAPASPPATAPATPPAASSTVEARLEFSDQFNDPTKGPGEVRLQLFDAGTLISRRGPQLDEWTFSLDTPESNRDHWDRTTRTYLFRLPLPPDVLAKLPRDRDHLLLAATVTLPNGSTLSDELPLPLKP